MALIRLGRFEEAADWAVKAAARPNAHPTILAIAAHCLALAGRTEEGRTFAATLRRTLPAYDVDDFLRTFRVTRVDRKRVVWGKSVSVRVHLGGRRISKAKERRV